MAESNIAPSEFPTTNDWKGTDIDSEISIKSNELIVQKNFESLAIFLKNFKAYVVYLRDLIDVDNLVRNVLENIQQNKLKVPINVDLNIGEFTTVKVGNSTYQIQRLDQYKIEISNLTNPKWIVDNLMVQVKDVEGVLVYPVITTVLNKVTLNFSDGIATNYNVFMV